MFDDESLIGREEVAEALGVAPESVRSLLRRHGLRERRGWVRDEVEALVRPGQGARTDLRRPKPDPEAEKGLRPGERALLDRVRAAHPDPVTRAQLDEHLPSRATLRGYLSTLRRRGLITETSEGIGTVR